MPSTPDQLAAKFDSLSRDLAVRIPSAGLTASAEVVRHALIVAAGRTKVPVPDSQFKIKRPRAKGGFASAMVVGIGFAVLGEYGSYHKPHGWDIKPKGVTSTGTIRRDRRRSREGSSLRGIEGKALANARALGYRKAILGDKQAGMAAAFAHHPPFAATPYKAAATAAAATPVAAAYDRLILGAIAARF